MDSSSWTYIDWSISIIAAAFLSRGPMEVVARLGSAIVLVIFINVFTLALSLCCITIIFSTQGLLDMVTVFEIFLAWCLEGRPARSTRRVSRDLSTTISPIWPSQTQPQFVCDCEASSLFSSLTYAGSSW